MDDKMFDITVDDRQVQKMIGNLLNKVERPKPLMSKIERYVNAITFQMFDGKRPDTSGVRGVKWKKLAPSTIKQKKALAKRGGLASGTAPRRPLVRTGKMRDSLKVLKRSDRGFEYGTRLKSKKGFPYPGVHNAGGKNGRPPQRPWIFLTRDDFAQIASMTVDFLEDVRKSFRKYVIKK